MSGSFVIPWTVTHQYLLCTWDFPWKTTGVGCYFLLQGIFLTQISDPHLLQWQADSLQLSYQYQLSSVQLISCVQLSVTTWTATCQASRSVTNSWSLLKLMSIELVMPSNHLILWHPLLLLPSIFPSIRVFSNESVLCIRCPNYWSFSFSIRFFQ